MTVRIDMGLTTSGTTATLDLEELLATRLLVQGNSGSGKSHLLRRLIEQSVPWVQQAIIDPEGDFVSLADAFGHVVIDASVLTENALQMIGGRVRQHRVSIILNLENLDAEAQMRHAAAFLGGLFDVERDYWFPMLVVVDEAQLFAPAVAGEVSDEARKASLGAMTNLMCRGRKRGLAGIIATQRLAKLAKNVAAEASNFLMGRTFLDIDMARAADLLGMERRQAETFRDLLRGHFVALGPALARRPLSIRIGDVTTKPRASSPRLLPLPDTPREDARELLFQSNETPRYSSRRVASMSTTEILQQLAASRPPVVAPSPVPESDINDEPQDLDTASSSANSSGDLTDQAAVNNAVVQTVPRPPARRDSHDGILAELLTDPEAVYRSVSVLYQDFLVRCRSHGLNGRLLDLSAFRRKLATARAVAATDGLTHSDVSDVEWQKALALAADLPEDVHGVFLLLARAGLEEGPCPSDLRIARALGSRSSRRARSMLTYMEQRGLVVCHEEMDGSRIISLPALEWQTAPGDPLALDDADDVRAAPGAA
ncbi:ATP-binding protein [Telmatospirillum sp.]|uniref:ATP-binding protein n=1 Tax=Telmatospirillum sp. TaxID=2079197 RepID=UPI0028475C52|nr:ATP-binding protein [Telmatospirillum sp.]MDR3440169.1 ATP-binding protein [Telmatospirillum sp.]